MSLQLLTNPQHPDPHLKLLYSPLPPLPHVCRHKPSAFCQCQGSVLVALDWLLASPLDEELMRRREGSGAPGYGKSHAGGRLVGPAGDERAAVFHVV
jgi:hypothetical protein